MKKTICFLVLFVVLIKSMGLAVARNALSAGYTYFEEADTLYHRLNGLNVKYSHEENTNPVGVIFSYTRSARIAKVDYTYITDKYSSIISGPIYQINNWMHVYGGLGLNYTSDLTKNTISHVTGFRFRCINLSYMFGFQLNLSNSIIVDLGYEQHYYKGFASNLWTIGLGYTF
ncbi:MAG: hypothetical protein FT671_01110 [Pantoea sp. Brub]|nr:hypothetical protein [Pantoea sp. Brub]